MRVCLVHAAELCRKALESPTCFCSHVRRGRSLLDGSIEGVHFYRFRSQYQGLCDRAFTLTQLMVKYTVTIMGILFLLRTPIEQQINIEVLFADLVFDQL